MDFDLILILVGGAFHGSTVSGVVGMAGGALLLGIMVLAGLDPLVAVPVHAAVQLVSNSTRVYAHLSNVRWRIWWIFAVCALPGPILGLWILAALQESGGAASAEYWKATIGVLIIYAAWVPKWGLARLSERIAFGTAGVLAGTLGLIVGATGPLIAPFFLRPTLKKEQIIATKAATQSYIHILKLIAFMGFFPSPLTSSRPDFDFAGHWQFFVPMGLVTILGTYTGKWILRHVSDKQFVGIYRVVLTALALRLMMSLF